MCDFIFFIPLTLKVLIVYVITYYVCPCLYCRHSYAIFHNTRFQAIAQNITSNTTLLRSIEYYILLYAVQTLIYVVLLNI